MKIVINCPSSRNRGLGGQSEKGRLHLGFTLIELFVVLGIIALLAATLAPTLAGSRIGSQSLRCMNDNRQLCAAWRMYADDSNDRLVYSSTRNSVGTMTLDPANPDNYAWTGAHMDFSGPNRANWDPAYDMMKRPLWPYNKSVAIYKCPSDHSVVNYVGISRPRILSFSMNLFVGGFAPARGAGPDGNGGGWPFTDPYRIFSKTTDLTAPGPAKTFIFIDMRPESINWGNFLTDMTGYPNNPSQYQFGDFPGVFHNQGASISFGDGHAEIHRWVDPRTAPASDSLSPLMTSVPSPDNQDIAWLQAHSTSPK
jgi:prepilin-type N-terminal cleavage/methylation domain-containing protein/prepilin-type processing-associated H-X9-DG protein